MSSYRRWRKARCDRESSDWTETLSRPGDVVFVARGSTYPLVLRPDGEEFRTRGFAYVHGLMHAEKKDLDVQVLKIR
jgi:hypothetical protein